MPSCGGCGPGACRPGRSARRSRPNHSEQVVASGLTSPDRDRVPAGSAAARHREGRCAEARAGRLRHDAHDDPGLHRARRWACWASLRTRTSTPTASSICTGQSPRPAAAAAPRAASTRSCASRCPATRSCAGSLTELLTRHPHRQRQPRRRHAAHRARRQAVGLGRRHRPRRRRRARPVHEPVLAGPHRARGQDPAARAGRQPGGRKPVHRPATRAARGLRARLPQPVPHELRRPDRTPVGGRRGTGHARGDRHRPGRRQLRVAALRGHAARRLPAGRATSTRCSSIRDSGRACRASRDRRRLPARAASDSSAASTCSATTSASKLYIADPNAARDDISTPVDFVTSAGGPVDIVAGPDEALYWVAINTGEVRKIVPGYPRPKGATPVLRASLVPAYQQCTAPNRTHGAALAFALLQPASAALGAAHGGHARRERRARPVERHAYAPRRSSAIPTPRPTRRTSRSAVSITDVRRSSGLADYTGQLQASARDCGSPTGDNPAASGLPAATVQDDTFAWTVPCSATPDTAIGSTCSVTTSADARHARRGQGGHALGLAARSQVQVFDGGAGRRRVDDAQHAVRAQGIFVP